MTQFPSLIDQVAAAVLAPAQVTQNPHHRAILDAFVEVQELDRQLVELADAELPGVSPAEHLNTLTDQLVERMAAGTELSALLSTCCCCAAAYEPAPEDTHEPEDDDEPDFDGPDDFEDSHEDACEDARDEFLSQQSAVDRPCLPHCLR